MSNAIKAGELWESVDHPSRQPHHGEPAGLCVVVGPLKAIEAPGSYVMMRLTPGRRRWEGVGQTLYMHQGAREAGRWVRRGALAALEEAPCGS